MIKKSDGGRFKVRISWAAVIIKRDAVADRMSVMG